MSIVAKFNVYLQIKKYENSFLGSEGHQTTLNLDRQKT